MSSQRKKVSIQPTLSCAICHHLPHICLLLESPCLFCFPCHRHTAPVLAELSPVLVSCLQHVTIAPLPPLIFGLFYVLYFPNVVFWAVSIILFHDCLRETCDCCHVSSLSVFCSVQVLNSCFSRSYIGQLLGCLVIVMKSLQSSYHVLDFMALVCMWSFRLSLWSKFSSGSSVLNVQNCFSPILFAFPVLILVRIALYNLCISWHISC